MYKYFFPLFLLVGLVSCGSLEREIEIDLPDYAEQPVVECYLEPNKPFRLLLSHSSSYFDDFNFGSSDYLTSLLIDSADVRISYNGNEVVLTNQLSADFTTFKVFNYTATELVPADYTSEFTLSITLKDGRKITGATHILAPVPIDSTVLTLNEDTLARSITYITDDPATTDFYRRMVHFGSLDSLIQDFIATDRLLADGSTQIAFGTGPQFGIGDTAIFTIARCDQAYYDFWRSVQGSLSANPGSQPGVILSNVGGDANPLGIFTGWSYTRDTIIIE